MSRKRIWVGLSLILALASLGPARALAQCGTEPWSVETGTDADVGLINLSSTMPTIIAPLLALPQSSSRPSNNRIQPTETNGTYFQPTAMSLTAYKGQTIDIVFHAKTDYTKPTTFRIDDVSLTTQ